MSLQRIEPYRRTDRCVNCGRAEALCQCLEFATMNLPEGRTRGDCMHLKHPCATIYGRIAADESCDWFPSRFSPRTWLPSTDSRDVADVQTEGKDRK